MKRGHIAAVSNCRLKSAVLVAVNIINRKDFTMLNKADIRILQGAKVGDVMILNDQNGTDERLNGVECVACDYFVAENVMLIRRSK